MKIIIKGEDFYLYKINNILGTYVNNRVPITGVDLYFISLKPSISIDSFVITKNDISIGKKTFLYTVRNYYRKPYPIILEEVVPYIENIDCISYSFLALNTMNGGENEKLIEKAIIESLIIKNTED